MSKIAIIRTGGKQYRVREGQTIKVEKLDSKEGTKLKLETLLVSDIDGKELQLGKPVLKESVEAIVKGEGKSKKITVVKYKNKTRYKRTLGHRQSFTELEIAKI